MESNDCVHLVTVIDVSERLKKNTERNVGKIMTILESSLTGPTLDAMKRLVKQEIWRNYNSFVQSEIISPPTRREGN